MVTSLHLATRIAEAGSLIAIRSTNLLLVMRRARALASEPGGKEVGQSRIREALGKNT